MIHEYWINAILSGPQTHLANIAGNALNAALDFTLQRGTEALINATLSTVGLGSAESPQVGEFGPMLRGLIPGIVRAWRNAWDAFGSETQIIEADVLNAPVTPASGKFGNPKAAIPGRPASASDRAHVHRHGTHRQGDRDDGRLPRSGPRDHRL